MLDIDSEQYNIFMIYLIKVIYRNKTPPLAKDVREGLTVIIIVLINKKKNPL